MSQQWRRFLPDRSQLWMLAVALVVVFAGVSFFNLYTEKVRALNEQRAVMAQLDQLRDQNQRLREAQTQVERGDNIEDRARQYFGFGYDGETRIAGQGFDVPTPVPVQRSAQPAQPSWVRWLKSLIRP